MMRIVATFAGRTENCLVDVYLETEREAELTYREIWRELDPLLDAQGIEEGQVVDFFLYRRRPDGVWVSVGMLPWDAY
jgi:hypothetical protein